MSGHLLKTGDRPLRSIVGLACRGNIPEPLRSQKMIFVSYAPSAFFRWIIKNNFYDYYVFIVPAILQKSRSRKTRFCVKGSMRDDALIKRKSVKNRDGFSPFFLRRGPSTPSLPKAGWDGVWPSTPSLPIPHQASVLTLVVRLWLVFLLLILLVFLADGPILFRFIQ